MNKKVFMSCSSDILHYGHIKIFEKAAELGELTVGVLTDSVVAQYKRLPLVPFQERINLIKSLSCVTNVRGAG